MIKKPTMVLIIGFVIILTLALMIDNTPQLTNQLRTPTPTAYLKLTIDLPQDQIEQVEIIQADQTLLLERQPNLGWVLPEDQKVKVNQEIVDANLSKLLALNILLVISNTQLDILGLDPAPFQIKLHGTNGIEMIIRIGKATTTNSGFYVAVDAQSPVVISKTEIDALKTGFSMQAISQNNPETTISP